MSTELRSYPPRGSSVIQAMLKRLAAEEEAQLKSGESKLPTEAAKPQPANAARI